MFLVQLTPLPNITVYYTVYRIWSHSRALHGISSLDKGFAALDSAQLTALRDELLRLQAATGVTFPQGSWPEKLIRKENRYLDIFDSLRKLQQQRRLEAQLQSGGAVEDVPTAAALLNPGNEQVPAVAPPLESGKEADRELQGKEEGAVTRTPLPPAPAPPATGFTGYLIKLASRRRTATNASTGLQLVFTASEELGELVRPAERLRSPLGDEAAMAIGKAFDVPYLIESVARARRRAVGSMFPAHTETWGGSDVGKRQVKGEEKVA